MHSTTIITFLLVVCFCLLAVKRFAKVHFCRWRKQALLVWASRPKKTESEIGMKKSHCIENRNVHQLVMFTAFLCVLFVSSPAFAGTGMPWEGTLQTILDSLQGPVAQAAGVISIVVTGIMLAVGEGGQMFKRAMQIAFGLSMAFGATTMVAQMGGVGGAII